MAVHNHKNSTSSQLLKSEKSDSGIDLNDPENIIREEVFEKPNDIAARKYLRFSPYDSDFEVNSKDFQGDTSCDLSSFSLSSENGSENKNVDMDRLFSTEEQRKVSSEIINQVLESAEDSLMDRSKNQSKFKTASNVRVNEKTSSEDKTRSENNAHVFEMEHSRQIINDKKCTNEIPLKDVLDKIYHSEDFNKKIEFEIKTFDPIRELDPDTICGIGAFKPQWLQPWATAKVYLVLYSIIGVLSGTYYSYLIGTMSTLEKRFSFKSKIGGLIMTVDEITPLFLGVFVGYFGGRAHRPRIVAFGMLLSSACCFVSALPYFIYGEATHLKTKTFQNGTGVELCSAEDKLENCDSDERTPTVAPIILLMFGSFLKGFGNLAYYAVGLAYMDDNSKKKNTPMYFAFAFALRLLGPLLGFLMSSAFLKYPENPFVDPEFSQDDPRWIGGWWMGFLVQGILLTIFTVPMSLFPRKLPQLQDPKCCPALEDRLTLDSKVGSLFAALKRLGRNPLFIFIVLNSIMATLGSFGHYIMFPKYMENQFRLSASEASLVSGPPGIASVIVSMLIGGYLIYRLKPTPKALTAGMVFLEVINAVGFLLLMIPQCEVTELSNFGLDNDGLILENNCNSNCNCSTSSFTPACSPDGNTLYFSPCYAGCKQMLDQEFTNCSCVLDSSGLQREYVTDGFCAKKDCWTKALAYIVTFPILQSIVSLLKAAYTMILLRSINPDDKSVALGVFETLISAFGFIPFPIVFGSLVDSACLVWEKSCGQTGNCWFYDVDKFNYLLHGASALFSSMSASCLFVIYLLSGRLGDLYEETKETNVKSKQNVKVDASVMEESDEVTRF